MSKRLASARSRFLRTRIPTFLGLGILLVALLSGILLLGDGPGVFAPRAAPETAPKNIKITNVTDSSFTVSFLTQNPTDGYLKYGTTEGSLNNQASDDRDQLSGSVGSFKSHHITARGLEPNTTYFYTLGTAGGSTYDNNGTPFKIRTAAKAGVPSAAKTVYGTVVTSSGGPADGAIVYVQVDGAGEMSSLVKNSGSWAIPLSNARTQDGSGYASIDDSAQMSIVALGVEIGSNATGTLQVGQAQPVPTLDLGKGGLVEQPAGGETGGDTEPSAPPTAPQSTPSATPTPTPTPTPGSGGNSDDASASSKPTSGRSSALQDQLADSDTGAEAEASAAAVIDIEAGDGQTTTSTSPTIKGTAAPQVVVTIEVNSETQVVEQVVTDTTGAFSLDLEALAAELEPGEHTASYTYTDPDTGEEISKTVSFTVAPDGLVAQANSGGTGSGPYSSANPYPRPTPTSSPASGSTSAPIVTPEDVTAVATTPTPSPSTASSGADTKGSVSTRSAQPSTSSGVPVSGSVGTTLTLILGGLFFIVSGAWSWWVGREQAS